jgi:hypothetical protein
MLKNIKEKVTGWIDDHEEVIIYGSYALSAGMVIGALLQSKKMSQDLKACCRLGADYHVDSPKEGVRYLFKFGQEALNNN